MKLVREARNALSISGASSANSAFWAPQSIRRLRALLCVLGRQRQCLLLSLLNICARLQPLTKQSLKRKITHKNIVFFYQIFSRAIYLLANNVIANFVILCQIRHSLLLYVLKLYTFKRLLQPESCRGKCICNRW